MSKLYLSLNQNPNIIYKGVLIREALDIYFMTDKLWLPTGDILELIEPGLCKLAISTLSRIKIFDTGFVEVHIWGSDRKRFLIPQRENPHIYFTEGDSYYQPSKSKWPPIIAMVDNHSRGFTHGKLHRISSL